MELETDKWGNVKAAPIIRKIAEMGFPVKDNLISYYSIRESLFVYIGREPIPENYTIPIDDIDPTQRLVLKCRQHSQISPSVQDSRKIATPLQATIIKKLDEAPNDIREPNI